MRCLHSLSLIVWLCSSLLCCSSALPQVAINVAAAASASSFVSGFNEQQQPNTAPIKRCAYNPKPPGFDVNAYDNDEPAVAPDDTRMPEATAQLTPLEYIATRRREGVHLIQEAISNLSHRLEALIPHRRHRKQEQPQADMSNHSGDISRHHGRHSSHHHDDSNQPAPAQDRYPPPHYGMYPSPHRGRHPPPPPPHDMYPPPHHGRHPPPPPPHGMYPPPHHGRHPPPPPHHGRYPPPPSHGRYPPSHFDMYLPAQHGMYPAFQDPSYGPQNEYDQQSYFDCDDNDTTTSTTTQKTTTTTTRKRPTTISPTPPAKNGSLITGTMRPQLKPSLKSTTEPPRSIELSKLRNIIFPDTKQYAHLFSKDAPSADGIDPR